MTTIIGIFGEGAALDRAVGAVTKAGFDERVFDPQVVRQEVATGVEPVVTPGVTPAPGSAGMAGATPQGTQEELRRALRRHLEDYPLDKPVVDDYVTSFDHNGKLLVVTVAEDRAREAAALLEHAGASRVDRHG